MSIIEGDPSSSKTDLKIQNYMATALSLGLCKSAQQKKGQSDRVQFFKDMTTVIKFFLTLGRLLLLDFLKANSLFISDVPRTLERTKGSLPTKLMGTLRKSSDDAVQQIPEGAGGFAKEMLPL